MSAHTSVPNIKLKNRFKAVDLKRFVDILAVADSPKQNCKELSVKYTNIYLI